MSTPPPLPEVRPGMSGKSKGCLGCFGLIIILSVVSMIASFFERGQQKQDFERDRSKIMADIQEAAKAGDHKRVVEIGKPYHLVEDYELRKLISASQKELDVIASAERQKREAIAAAEKEKKAQSKIDEAKQAVQKSSENKKSIPLVAMEESFKLGGFSYTVISAQRTTKIGLPLLADAIINELGKELAKSGSGPSPDDASYLVVRYRIKNDGNESAIVSTSDFKVIDSKGRKFSADAEATAELVASGEADFALTELQPGIGEDGVQAFKLPNSSFDGSLILVVPEKGILSFGERRVNLGL